MVFILGDRIFRIFYAVLAYCRGAKREGWTRCSHLLHQYDLCYYMGLDDMGSFTGDIEFFGYILDYWNGWCHDILQAKGRSHATYN